MGISTGNWFHEHVRNNTLSCDENWRNEKWAPSVEQNRLGYRRSVLKSLNNLNGTEQEAIPRLKNSLHTHLHRFSHECKRPVYKSDRGVKNAIYIHTHVRRHCRLLHDVDGHRCWRRLDMMRSQVGNKMRRSLAVKTFSNSLSTINPERNAGYLIWKSRQSWELTLVILLA